MNTEPIALSICIPTFNRGAYLRETLDSLLNQLTREQCARIELVVSDNASTDNTDELLRDYQARHPTMVVHRWPENMGADRNYLKVVELAHGEYCWFMGSDDKAMPGSVAMVLDAIRDGAPDIALFDRMSSDRDLSSAPEAGSWTTLPGDCRFDSRTERSRFHAYLRGCASVGGLFSYISTIVFRKRRWDAVPDKFRFVGNAYVHTHALFTLLKDGAVFHYHKKPLVLCRMGNDSFCSDPNSMIAVFNRWKLDIDGYREVSMAVFGSDSVECELIHGVLDRYINLRLFITLDYWIRQIPGHHDDRRVARCLRNNGFFAKYVALRISALTITGIFGSIAYRLNRLVLKCIR